MNAAGHIGVSAAGGALIGLATGSVEMGTGFFLSGWLVDLDQHTRLCRDMGLAEGLPPPRLSRVPEATSPIGLSPPPRL